MTDKELELALEVCSKATPGPWRVFNDCLQWQPDPGDGLWDAVEEKQENINFITSASASYPQALRELLAAKAEIERLKNLAAIQALYVALLENENHDLISLVLVHFPNWQSHKAEAGKDYRARIKALNPPEKEQRE